MVRRLCSVLAGLVVGAAALAAPAAAGPPGGDGGGGSGAVVAAPPLPMITRVLPNGAVVKEADRAAFAALKAKYTDPGCGDYCNGQDPQTYVWHGPGGPGNWYPCANDARTVAQYYDPGGGPLQVELRYSPRCRTAWAREPGRASLRIQSYLSNGNARKTAIVVNDPYEASYSPMVNDAGYVADACIGSWTGNGGTWWWFDCTTRY